jgi:hypothetical protein
MKQWSFDVRSWGPKPGHPLKEGNEQAWKDHLFSLAAALLDGLFEHSADAG